MGLQGARRIHGCFGAVLACAALVGVVGGCEDLDPVTGALRQTCADADSDPQRPVSFKNDIRPLMSGLVHGTTGCKRCHYPSFTAGTREGFLQTGLNLEQLGTLRQGGRNTPPGKIVVPGKPCSSAIVQKLQGTFGDARMPKGGPYWTAAQIQLVIDWIAEGAQGADDE